MKREAREEGAKGAREWMIDDARERFDSKWNLAHEESREWIARMLAALVHSARRTAMGRAIK
jgi:hypothetical protein